MALTELTPAEVNDLLTRESGRIHSDVLVARQRTPKFWRDAIPRGTWPDEMGIVLQTMRVEHSAITDDDETWTNIGLSDGTTSPCLPTADELTVGQTLASYRPQVKVTDTPKFCLDDIRSSALLSRQLEATVQNLFAVSDQRWELRHKNETLRLAGLKINVNSAMTESTGEGFATDPPPTSGLTNAVVDKYVMWMRRNAQGDLGWPMAGGVPIGMLVTDPETSMSIKRENAELRNDIRYAYMGEAMNSPLLQPWGVSERFGNAVHIIDDFPPRYDLVGGAWVRRNVYASSEATKGTKRILDPLYEAAEFTVSYLYSPSTWTEEVPKSITTIGGSQMTFKPQDYSGTFHYINILSETLNPFGTIVFFKAKFESASRPRYTENTIAFLHRRCPNNLQLANCS